MAWSWLNITLFQVILSYLVYEKQQKLKIMMKMHGLKDGPYWLISYAYFFALSAIYMILFLIFGSLIGNKIELYSRIYKFCRWVMYLNATFLYAGLNFFRTNAYSIQIVFYFIYINLQIALAFFVASFFSTVKIATGWCFAYVASKFWRNPFFSQTCRITAYHCINSMSESHRKTRAHKHIPPLWRNPFDTLNPMTLFTD